MREIINIENLVVNPKNYRFDPVENPGQALDLMLEEKSEELVVLARHILQYGIDQAKNLRVLEIKKGLYKILEGNRRVTVLKCLQNPSIIKIESLRIKFVKLVEEFKKEGKYAPTRVACYIYKTEAEAAPFLRLDHTGKNEGAGLDPWGYAEQNRFDYDWGGKLSPAMQAVDLYEAETKSKIKDRNELKLTTIDRIIASVEGRAYLGLGMSKGKIYPTSSIKEVTQRLDILFNKMLTDDVPVRELYDTALIGKFMKKLLGDKPKLAKKAISVPQATITKKEDKVDLSKILPKSNGRNVLIPDTCRLAIHEPKINNIYHELMGIPLDQACNATGVLLRVFVEISLDYYLSKNGIPFDHNTKLSKKIELVTNKLEIDKAANQEQLKHIRRVANKGNHPILSIDHFNEYVHSIKVQPLPMDLINTWDSVQEFFEILWGEISKKYKKR